MIDYKLAKQLKEAGFPQDLSEDVEFGDINKIGFLTNDGIYVPTLSELIEACVKKITELTTDREEHWFELYFNTDPDNRKIITEWGAGHSFGEDRDNLRERENFFGKTPEEAVAKLWLKLNKKPPKNKPHK